jgi:hypothetical protein
MASSLTEALHDWRDFYMLAGAASATLVGLMFVAASIGASLFNEKHLAPMRAFLSPTVVHFSSILFACILLTMPDHDRLSLGSLLGLGALAGLVYCGRVLAVMLKRFGDTLDWIDRAFYALAPALGYLLLLAAAALELSRQPAIAHKLIAAAFVVLLVAGLRNAWDMMVWIAVRTPAGASPPAGPERDP